MNGLIIIAFMVCFLLRKVNGIIHFGEVVIATIKMKGSALQANNR
jgi:hypothetical protein